MGFLGQGAGWNHVAMEQAIRDSGVEEKDISNPRTGIVMGSGGPSTVAIVEAAEQLAADPAVRVGVLSGEGRGFCAGLDIAAFMGGDADGESFDVLGGRAEGRIANMAQQVAYAWTELPVPVIAAVHGVATGATRRVATACDFRLDADHSHYILAFNKAGLAPDADGT